MKVCNACKIKKELSGFTICAKNKCGFQSRCKQCANEYYEKNKDRYAKNQKEYLTKNKEKRRKWRREYYLKNKEREIECAKLWELQNKGARKAIKAKYRTSLLNAIPKWVDMEELKKVYNNCPEGYEVDHIIPLQGKTVCGLHVPWNLQYLTKSENCSKGTKIIQELASA